MRGEVEQPNRQFRSVQSALFHFACSASFFASLDFSWEFRRIRYNTRVNLLTKQEQIVLCLILVLLLTGWAVKTYRTAHPPAAVLTTQRN